MVTISTIIPTYNRTALLMERCLPSLFNQTFDDWEAIVVGDGTERATVDAMATITDPRVKFWNLPHADYPEDPRERWALSGMEAINFGLTQATGDWISVLSDDDAYTPVHHEALLAGSRNVDVVYGQSLMYRNGATFSDIVIGLSYPPKALDICQGAYLARRSLDLHHDRECITRGHSWDSEMWHKLFERRVRFRMINRIVHRYHASLTSNDMIGVFA